MAGDGRYAAAVYRAMESLGKRIRESFNGKLRDECLNGEIFYSLKEAQVVVGMRHKHYNTIRPHNSLGYRALAPMSWIVAA
jgi:transposase InsO family protein